MTAVESVPEGPSVVGSIILIRPDQIDATKRLLPIDPIWVDALASLMKTDGQLTPVEVCRLPGRSDYTLVTGGHRHAAAEKNGMYLRAEVITSDATQRRLREANENVNRRDLAPLDRAKAIAELVAVQKIAAGIDPEKDGRAASANARWHEAVQKEADDATDILSVAYGWTDEVAERTGLNARTIRRDLELLRGIPANIVEALRRKDHPVFRNASQLRALAGLEPTQQAKVLGLLLHADAKIADAPFDKVTDAIAALGDKPRPPADAKHQNAFLGSFRRMTPQQREGAIPQLKSLLPKGWVLAKEGEASAPTPAFSAKQAEYREQTLAAIDAMRELIDGVMEDELLPFDRAAELRRASTDLQLARFSIVGNGFQLGGDDE